MGLTLKWTKLEKHLMEKITHAPLGAISFNDWMEAVLYHPTEGYYSRSSKKIGKEGDFYTVSSVGGIFAEAWLETFAEMIDRMGEEKLTFLEWGGGEGTLSVQWHEKWVKHPKLSQTQTQWIMLEKSPYHRKLQQEAFCHSPIPVRWIEDIHELQDEDRSGLIIFSNELLDAFPVHRVRMQAGGLEEAYVTWDESSRGFDWEWHPASEELTGYISTYQIKLENGQEAEINLELEKWFQGLAQVIQKGYLITVDYGDETEQLYSSHRREGTLVSYSGHRMSKELLLEPGQRDLTSQVHFTPLLDKGPLLDLQAEGFWTQREFLLNTRILERIKAHQGGDPFQSEIVRLNRAIRSLIEPGGMSDRFKVLIQSKNIVHPKPLSCSIPYFK
jgi:SAM-dependent MidA family methyltransferase